MNFGTLGEKTEHRHIHINMEGVAQHLRLPLSQRSWKGTTGNWLGVGIGSSIDFQDHRPYLPGDDPRYIDWMVYARTGQYTMKLYREEVSPHVDLIVDLSASMSLHKAKYRRVIELIYFCVESALQAGASLRCTVMAENEWTQVPVEALLSYQWDMPKAVAPENNFAWTNVPFQHGSMRVWISDLLFSGAPEPAMKALTDHSGFGVILAPSERGEENPDWRGNVELVDCETGTRRKQKAPPELLQRYRDAYRRHFEMWSDCARQFNVALARIPDDGDFVSVLAREGLPVLAVEACR